MAFSITPIGPTIPSTPPEFSQFIQFENDSLPLGAPDVQIVNFLDPWVVTRGVGENAHVVTAHMPPFINVGLTGVQATADTGLFPTFGSGQLFLTMQVDSPLTLSNANLTGIHSLFTPFDFEGAYISDRNNDQSTTITDNRYFEVLAQGVQNGVMAGGFVLNTELPFGAMNPFGESGFYIASGIDHSGLLPGVVTDGTLVANGSYFIGTGTTLGVAVNGSNGNVWYSINGAWIGDPVNGTNPAHTLPSLDSTPFVVIYSGSDGTQPANLSIFLGSDLQYPTPVGFKPWNQLTP